MKTKITPYSAALLTLLAVTLIAAAGCVESRDWDAVWAEVQKQNTAPDPVPVQAREDGPPVQVDGRILFRIQTPPDVKRVYLAGDFNAWALNNKGKVTAEWFAMEPVGEGRWFRWEDLHSKTHKYSYVLVKEDGSQDWIVDPNAKENDGDGHSLLKLAESLGAPPEHPVPVVESFLSGQPEASSTALKVAAQKVWTRPSEENTILVNGVPANATITLTITTPLGTTVHESQHKSSTARTAIPVPALGAEGGYIARVVARIDDGREQTGETILSAVDNVADDLRYGFFASYQSADGDYAAKADMLAGLHVNAVEFYDYFPAHGLYAPREMEYAFEPFGIKINGLDIKKKIDAGHKRNILSIAYVAAYAASESVYKKNPYPMTDGSGAIKIFNGEVMTEEEADRKGKPKWFWIMNVASDSPWHDYIMKEFGQAMDDDSDDIVSFDGFEIDTYGDNPDTKFHAKGSKHNGELLTDVLHDFVGDVQKVAKNNKSHGLVSFNSINEFGASKMIDVTDFLFMEIWRFYTTQVEELVDICHRHRAPRRQRVVLKIYPADMDPKQTAWPPGALARTLGATMTGGGSLMVVGEPDEKNDVLHGLNSLFYPDHQPLVSGNEEMIRAYYSHDAMWLGFTHGKDVHNTKIKATAPECITRTYAAPVHSALVVQLLRPGTDSRWSSLAPLPNPAKDLPVSIPLPEGVAPKEVFYSSPDSKRLAKPSRLDFRLESGCLRLSLPELRVHGTLVLKY